MTGIQESLIMVVEDNAALKESIIELLSLRGFHNFSTFSDGFTAVNYCIQSMPDIAILDVEMPGLSGLDILDKIKSIRPKLPVVMMSSRHDRHIILQACESGANTFFPKPFDSEMFCRKIEDLLNRVDFLR